MPDDKKADEETLSDTTLHGHNEGRELDEGEDADGGPVEERDQGDESLGGPTAPNESGDAQTTSGGGEGEGSERTHDDTPPPEEGAGEQGLGTRTGGIGGGERSEGGFDKPR